MLSVQDVKARIEAAFPGSVVEVADPRGSSNYFEALVISEAFAGMPRIKRHRTVNALFAAELQDGTVHALSLRTFTPEQFARL